MNIVKAIASKVIESRVSTHKATAQAATSVCNYADNYYGDRVCVMPRKA